MSTKELILDNNDPPRGPLLPGLTWKYKRSIGKGGQGRAHLWVLVDNSGNIIERLVIKNLVAASKAEVVQDGPSKGQLVEAYYSQILAPNGAKAEDVFTAPVLACEPIAGTENGWRTYAPYFSLGNFETLVERHTASSPLPEPFLWFVLYRMAKAAVAMDEVLREDDRGPVIVHSDIKLDNIFLAHPGSLGKDADFIMYPPAYLADFGFSYTAIKGQSTQGQGGGAFMFKPPEMRDLKGEHTPCYSYTVSYDEVLAYTQELELNLASLPDWAGDRLRDLTAHDQSVALLHIQLEQFLLILHGHAARQAVTKTHITFSKQAFKSAAVSILDKLSELSAKGFKFLLMVRADIQRVFTSTLALGNTEDKDISTQDLRNLVQPSLELADKALDLFEEKILTTGGIQWTHTFLVYDMLLCKVHPLGRNMPSRPGSGRIYSICKKIMDNQDSDFSAKVVPLKDSVPTPKKNKGQWATKMHVTTEDNTTQQPPPALNSDVVPNLSFSDMLDWNFDDWMLYTDMFWSPQNMSLPSLSEQNLQY
ncbi:hypothetical protein D6C83_03569 [Aureobasidium pullulans]|uniref:Protein kinase domain-containing protein n=1 Tax=Aureobasidium pullulans TaxID=5580 RepID=A0A4V4LKC1_AURPU|nr:hypothetical protein D6C83_03569 [Aureobasidium pullulans]